MAGILAGEFAGFAPGPLLGCAGLAALGVLVFRRTLVVLIFVGVAFALLHLFRSGISPAARLAEWVSACGPVLVSGSGRVVSEPEELMDDRPGGAPRWRMVVRLREAAARDGVWTEPGNVLVFWTGDRPAYGDAVAFEATASVVDPPRNPGEFDQREYWKRRGVFVVLRIGHPWGARIESRGGGNPFVSASLRARDWMCRKLTADLDDSPGEAGVVTGVALGLKDDHPEDLRDSFRQTGTLHLFAVSGLNVGMFALVVWQVLKLFMLTRKQMFWIVVPVLVFYAAVTGFQSSVIRATVMSVVVLGANLSERRPQLLNSVAGAAFLLLLWDGNQLFLPGFQLSFTVVFALALLADRWSGVLSDIGVPDPFIPAALLNRVQRFWQRAGAYLAGSAGTSAAAWAGSLALSWWYFHLVSLIAIASNILVVPVAFLILVVALLSLGLSGFWGFGGILANNANWLLAKVLLWIVSLCALVPGGHWYVGRPDFSGALAEFTVFDFGDGGAVHLRDGSRDWLIDAGDRFAGRVVLNRLRQTGGDAVDGIVLTHGDAGHVGGAGELIERARVGGLFVPEAADRSPARRSSERAARAAGMPVRPLAAGDVIEAGPHSRIEVLFPPRGIAARHADDKALVLRLCAGDLRVLFVSDAGFQTAQWLTANVPAEKLRADILVAGRHRTEPDQGVGLIGRIQPRVVVMTHDTFPPEEAVPEGLEELLRAQGVALLRQDRTGAVRVVLKKDGAVRITPFLAGEPEVEW